MAAEQSNELPVTTEVLPGDLSSIFRRHREEHGLNINQVAEALCLSPKIITSIEAENLDGLPEPPYVRGYLRSFAKYIEIDPTEMINAYEKLRGAKPNELDYHFNTPPATKTKKRGISSGMLKLGLLIVLLGLLAILSMIPSIRDWAGNTWNQFSDQADPGFTITDETNPLLTGNIPPPLPINEEASGTEAGQANATAETNEGFPGVGSGPISAETPAATTDATATETAEQTEEAAATDTEATEETTEEATAAPEGSSVLKLTFNDEVWMRIRDNDKKKLFEALSQKGDSKELTLPRPMEIRVGNAQALDLTVDGEPFDMTPFIRGSVANFTIE
ncbi:helix-turn-helix domain-containing protein [Leucothrix sargassi]|nr:helix-turn-helix domain-containing protein [Leucothrix sargassi]